MNIVLTELILYPIRVANANRFENLTDGTYNISVRDANGCVLVSNPVVIDRPNPPTDLTIVESQITCPDQTVSLTANLHQWVLHLLYFK